MEKAFVLNPITNKSVLVHSATYKKLVKEGTIKPYEPPQNTPPEPQEEPQQPIKAKLAHEMVDIVATNKSKFNELSKKETDKLLRKLLVAKLTDKRKKNFKKKKPKYKIVEPSSSESESDASETSDDDSNSD